MISQEQKKNDLVTAIDTREKEIYGYQFSIDNYTSIIKMITSEWTEGLSRYKGLTSEQIVDSVPEEHIQLVSDLAFKDKITKTLQTEKLEQSKANHILNALKAQLEK